ncbi:MAG: dUTP diphosphatase [Acidimicrobiia bacterium]
MSEPGGLPRVAIVRLDPDLALPSRRYSGDAGYDLHARVDVVLAPGGGRAAVPTGIALSLPEGWAGLVLPRSGLALHHGVTCLNAPGLIDSGYRDEVRVVLVNHDPVAAFAAARGDRIAQLVLHRLDPFEWDEVDDLDDSERSRRGFGSSGL